MARLVTSDGVQVNLFLDLDSHNTGEGTLLYGPKSQPNMDFIVQGFKDFRTNTEFNNKNRLVFHCHHEITVNISSITGGNYPTVSNPHVVDSETQLYYVGDDLVLSKTGTKIHRIDLFKSNSTNFDNLQTQILTNDDDISQLNTGLTNLINNGGGGGSGNSTPVESMFPLSPEISNASSCFFSTVYSASTIASAGSLSFDYSNATSAEKSVISNLQIGVGSYIIKNYYQGFGGASAIGVISKIDTTNEIIQITLTHQRPTDHNSANNYSLDPHNFYTNTDYQLYQGIYDANFNPSPSLLTGSLKFLDGQQYDVSFYATASNKWMKVEAGVDNSLYEDWRNVSSYGIAKLPVNLSNIPAESTHIVFEIEIDVREYTANSAGNTRGYKLFNRSNFNYRSTNDLPEYSEQIFHHIPTPVVSSRDGSTGALSYEREYYYNNIFTVIVPNNSYFIDALNTYSYNQPVQFTTNRLKFKPVGYFIEGSSSAGVSSLNGQTGDVTLDTYTKTEVDNIVSSSGGSNVEIFYASTNWTKPAGVTFLQLILVGGGAGGGASSGVSNYTLANAGDTSVTFPSGEIITASGGLGISSAASYSGAYQTLQQNGRGGFLGNSGTDVRHPSVNTTASSGGSSYVYGEGILYPGGTTSNPDGDPDGWSGGASSQHYANPGNGGGSTYATLGGSGSGGAQGNMGGSGAGVLYTGAVISNYFFGSGGGGAGAGGGGYLYSSSTSLINTTHTMYYGGQSGQILEFDKIVSSTSQTCSIVIGAGGNGQGLGGGGGQGIVIIKY